MIEWSYLLKIAIALFAIVNPIGTVPIFITATAGWNKDERKKTAKTVAFTVFTVLLVSTVIGDKLLDFFGISIPSFQVGGGILLLLIAISMMHGKQSDTRQTSEEAQTLAERKATAIVPLSIPLLAGPGAISSMIIAAQRHPSIWSHLTLSLPVAAISLLVWVSLSLSGAIARRLGSIGINVVTRLMGLILSAMAVEFMAHGLVGLFPKLAN